MGERAHEGHGAARGAVYVLRGLLICGLVVTAGTDGGVLHSAFRAALPILAGLVLGTALAEAENTGRTIPIRWTLHLVVIWLATLSPLMWGNREVLRTCAVSGAVAILFRRGRTVQAVVWAVATVAVLAALASSASPWLQRALGELQYALGGAWPRGWAHIAQDAVLFMIGCGAARGRGVRAAATWGGIAGPLRALGRMPLTTAAVQYVAAAAVLGFGHAGGQSTWAGPALIDCVLIAQLIFAARWLRDHQRGPCEHALHFVQATTRRSSSRLRAVLAGR